MGTEGGLRASFPRDSVGAIVEVGAARTPDRFAMVEAKSGRRITYSELHRQSNRLANALIGLGFTPGERLAAWMRSGIDYLVLYFGAAKAGLVVVPINERFKEREATHILSRSGASALIFAHDLTELVQGLDCTAELKLICSTGTPELAGAVAFGSLLDSGSDADVQVPHDHDLLYVLGYTSGTTGFPKGAMLTQRSMRQTARNNAFAYRLPMFSVGAFFTSMSFVSTVPAFVFSHLWVGGSVVLLQGNEPDYIVDMIERIKANYMSLPSPLLPGVTDELERRPGALRTLTTVLHSASPAPPEQLRRLAAVIGSRLLEGWGMTENSGGLVTATTPWDVTGEADSSDDVFSSVGRAVPDATVTVVDADRTNVSDPDTVGELVIRTPGLMSGYWGDPEATERSLRDGWYFTGDLGRKDEAGYVYIVDRRDDLILSGGINVYPSEVESVLRECQGVRDCAVVSVPHERWGQSVGAVIVREQGANLSEDDVTAHCRQRMASFKKPTRILFIPELPRTIGGKIRRQELRELIAVQAITKEGMHR